MWRIFNNIILIVKMLLAPGAHAHPSRHGHGLTTRSPTVLAAGEARHQSSGQLGSRTVSDGYVSLHMDDQQRLEDLPHVFEPTRRPE